VSRKVTRAERYGLDVRFNLADAHTHQGLNEKQHDRIRSRLPEIFDATSRAKQRDLEISTYDRFMELNGQTVGKRSSPLVCYSASMAMEVIANHARSAGDKVVLVEPCFDNIPDILKRHGISLTPISPDAYADPAQIVDVIEKSGANVLMLVLPNNPTGHIMGTDEFQYVCQQCESRGVTVWLDFCFRLYDSRLCTFDQYQILFESGVKFISIEDTGKIWPSLDQKISFMLSSSGLHASLLSIHDDFLLNVSPFTLGIVSSFCEVSGDLALRDFREIVAINRHALQAWLAESLPSWISYTPTSRISVEFGDIGAGAHDIGGVLDAADRAGVAVLPGDAFYWAGEAGSRQHLRFALARDNQYLAEALRCLGQEL
jgi:aspartate/methionine/tyrosine aminotransferase